MGQRANYNTTYFEVTTIPIVGSGGDGEGEKARESHRVGIASGGMGEIIMQKYRICAVVPGHQEDLGRPIHPLASTRHIETRHPPE
jgi:hypothetical protein